MHFKIILIGILGWIWRYDLGKQAECTAYHRGSEIDETVASIGGEPGSVHFVESESYVGMHSIRELRYRHRTTARDGSEYWIVKVQNHKSRISVGTIVALPRV